MSGLTYLLAAERIARDQRVDPWTSLMLALLERIRDLDVPAPLAPVVEQAERHWSGDHVDLAGAKVAAWRFIDAVQPSSSDARVPEGRVARAILCVLEPEGDVEARSMTAEWFAAMADKPAV